MVDNPQETIGNLINKKMVSLISAVDENGFPSTMGMLAPVKREGLKTFYWHTNNPSRKIKYFINNPKACIYFMDEETFCGAMLKGTMEVLKDEETKKELWKDDFNIYYEGGMNGGDFTILKFTANTGRYYDGETGTYDFNVE